MYFFLDVGKLSVLATLCKEFDVEWIKEKIKNYLEKIETRPGIGLTSKYLLSNLEIASKMEFNEATTNLVNQLDESFIYIQMYPEFSALDTKGKILIARKRLWFLMNFVDNTTKDLLLNNETAGLLSILKDFKQKPISFAKSPNKHSYQNYTVRHHRK